MPNYGVLFRAEVVSDAPLEESMLIRTLGHSWILDEVIPDQAGAILLCSLVEAEGSLRIEA